VFYTTPILKNEPRASKRVIRGICVCEPTTAVRDLAQGRAAAKRHLMRAGRACRALPRAAVRCVGGPSGNAAQADGRVSVARAQTTHASANRRAGRRRETRRT